MKIFYHLDFYFLSLKLLEKHILPTFFLFMRTNNETLKYQNFVNDFIAIIAQEGIPESYPEFFINFLRASLEIDI
jgi:hypothetical protein